MRSLFKDRLFNKHYEKLLADRKREQQRPAVNTISSVTILANAKDHSIQELESGPKYFRKLDIQCDLYVIHDDKDETEMFTNARLIDSKECMWYGIPSQEILIKWLSNKTDLLIISQPDGLLMKYLCAASNSMLKAAVKSPDLKSQGLDIDLWVEVDETSPISLSDQCRITYEMLSQLGIRPPVIE